MDEQLRGYRKDRVAAYLRTYTEAFLARGGPERSGLDASGAAAGLSLDRANVSRDLNALYRDGIAVKLLGKPTRYLHYQAVAERYPDRYVPNTVPIGQRLQDYLAEEAASPQEPLLSPPEAALADSRYPSLHLAAVQAESAVRYPPHGLHTLLLGPFGSGKYGFARRMFAYGKAVGRFAADAKFYVLDASGSGGSAQSLIIQLFGCAAGAASPSAAGRKGLVERAEGSLLLLSEAQALPPPVQEKLISLMLYGTFSRFGEASVHRPCKALLAATCSSLTAELPQAPLLKYFPMQITLPALSKRTADERFLYLYQLFQAEAKALDCAFPVQKDVLYFLLCATDSGDFITLRGLVKSVCAMACREALPELRRNVFPVEYRHLPLRAQTCAAAPPSAADFYALLDRYPGECVVIHADSIPLAPPSAQRGAAEEDGALPPDPSGFLFIKHYLEEYLRAAAEGAEPPPDTRPPLTAQILRRIGGDPVLGTLTAQDPLMQGLASLFAGAMRGDLNYQILQQPEAAALSAVSSELRLTALGLERDLCRLFGAESAEERISFLALCLCYMKDRLRSNAIRLFFLFHGRGVSEGLASYVDRLCGCAAVPLGFDETSTAASLRAELDAALSALPAGSQVLLFSDGPPFQTLQEDIQRTYGLPAKNLCGATFETVLRTVRNVTRFHFTLDMIDDRPAPPAEAPAPDGKAVSLVTQAMQGVLAPSLSFLDVDRAIPLLEDSLCEINRQLGLDGSDNVSIRYQFHCAHMIERLIRKEPLDYPRLKAFVNAHSREFRVIGQALQPIAQTFGIKLPAGELAYLAEIFLSA